MKTRVRNLTIELCSRRLYKNRELKLMLLKSIIQTKTKSIKYKSFFCSKQKIVTRKINLCKQHDLCMFTGNTKGVMRLVSMSRHSIKKLALTNKIQNIKISSW